MGIIDDIKEAVVGSPAEPEVDAKPKKQTKKEAEAAAEAGVKQSGVRTSGVK